MNSAPRHNRYIAEQLLRRALLLPIAVLVTLATAQAHTPADDPKVKEAVALAGVWLDAQRAYEQIPAISAAIVLDQQVVWSAGLGDAELQRKMPATPSTIYSICSISKLFTSIGIMQLRDAGKLRLDDPVDRHLPWLKIRRNHPEGGDITIEGLLTHASGLPREADFPYWSGPDYSFPTREQLIERLVSQETLYPAETYWQYSNLGLTLAGEIVAAASGMPYASYVQQKILKPIGLSSTTPEIPATERGKRLATGYSALRRDGTRRIEPLFQTRGLAPAAGYASTVEDLARFASWQFRALAGATPDVLAANTLREMHRLHWIDQDFTNPYGLGFRIWRSNEKTFVGHGGSCPGFVSLLLLKPDEKFAVVVLANAQGFDPQQLAQRLYDIVSPALRDAAKDPSKPRTVDPSLDKYVGRYEHSTFVGELAVVRWEDGLATLNLPTADPVKTLTRWKKTGEHSFRRVREDGALGESMDFDIGTDGVPTRLRRHNQNYPRIAD